MITRLDSDSDAPRRLPSKGIPVLVYCVTLLAAMAAYMSFHPTGLWLVATFAVPAAALCWCVAVTLRRRRDSACATSPANRAYLRRFFPMMILYVLFLFGAVWL